MNLNHKKQSFNELRSRAKLALSAARALALRASVLAAVFALLMGVTMPSWATANPAPVPGSGDLLKTITGLLFTLGLLFGLLWLLKKTGMGMQPRGRGFYRIVASSSLGSREKICLLEIGDTWLVVGMTAHSMNTLHTLPAGSIDLGGNTPPAAEQFAKLLGHFKPKAKTQANTEIAHPEALKKEAPPKEPTS